MKQKGFTMAETVVALGLFSLLVVGVLELYAGSLRFFSKTTADVEINNENATAMRYITQTLRSAMDIQIQDNGNTLIYTMPKMNNSVEPLTGEVELMDPPTSDGINRSFTIANGKLTDTVKNKVMVDHLTDTDPDPDSSQYGKVYAPFQLTTIGSRRAITVTLISKKYAGGEERYTRMKNTVILRNSQ